MPRFELSRRTVTVALALVMVSVLAGAILGPGLLREEPTGDRLEARFTVSKSMLRLGETVMCFANESEGDIDGCHWDYGDGNTSTRFTGSHLYEFGGWYNITLTVFDGERSANATVTVGVQPSDFSYSNDFGEIRHWFQDGRRGTTIMGTVGPSIGRPTVRASFHLENAIGEMSLEVGLRVGGHYMTIVAEHIDPVMEDIDRELVAEPTSLPRELEEEVSVISAELWIDNGQVRGGALSLDIVFPFEDLAPPVD